jgi:hypothetical protein
MKHFIVQSGDFVATSGIYRMNDHPEREITLIYGDAVPTFQGKGQVSTDPSCEESPAWLGTTIPASARPNPALGYTSNMACANSPIG